MNEWIEKARTMSSNQILGYLIIDKNKSRSARNFLTGIFPEYWHANPLKDIPETALDIVRRLCKKMVKEGDLVERREKGKTRFELSEKYFKHCPYCNARLD